MTVVHGAAGHADKPTLLPAVLAEIIQADVSKTLALTISFGRIRAEQFWSTFQERLGPLMMEVGRTRN